MTDLNYTENVTWFEKKSSELYLEINKLVLNKKIADRVKYKLEESIRFFKEYNKRLNKEVLFLIYWSCLNEFSSEWIREWYPEMKFKDSFILKEDCINSSNQKCYSYYKIVYKLLNSEMICYTFKKIDNISEKHPNDINKITFYLQAFLINRKVPDEILLLYNYLGQKRNKLNLTHGNERGELISAKLSDNLNNVTLEDCRILLNFISYIFLLDLDIKNEKNNIVKNKMENDLKNIFKKEDKLIKNYLFVTGKLIEKNDIKSKNYEGKFWFNFKIEYLVNNEIQKLKIEVKEEDYKKFNIDNILHIEYKIELRDNYNNIKALKIYLKAEGPLQNS